MTRAAADGDSESVRELLAKGADVNSRSGGGQTPLMLAVIGGHGKVVELLRAAGADARLRDNLGLTVFDWAERRGFHELTRLFEQGPTDVEPAPPSPPPRVDPPKPEPSHPSEPVNKTGDRSQRWLEGMKQRWREEDLRQNRTPSISPPVQEASTTPSPKPPTEIPPKVVEAPVQVQNEASSSIQAESKPAATVEPVAVYAPTNVLPTQPEPLPIERTLVDTTPSPTFISEPKSNRRILSWLAVGITLLASGAVTYYFYGRSSTPSPASTAAVVQPTPEPVVVKKNSPLLSDELIGKELNLPEPEYPARAKSRGISGTVVVRVRVNRRGRVVLARSSGGDWQLRAAAVDAATKSTFDPTKLPERGTQGTIRYTFGP